MEPIRIFKFVWIGTALRYLWSASEGIPIHGEGRILGNMRDVITHLADLNLHVTLRQAHLRLDELIVELAATEETANLTTEQATTVSSAARTIRDTLEAEGGSVVAWLPSEKRYSIAALTGNVRSLMGAGVYDALPAVAKYDFEEAGKCIAFGLPTAGAFHLLRGTEDVLRLFYCGIVKRRRVKPLMWGNMVTSLRNRAKPPTAILLSDLDSIRTTFRNPTQHPELVYDLDMAQDLFARCIDVVGRMHRHP